MKSLKSLFLILVIAGLFCSCELLQQEEGFPFHGEWESEYWFEGFRVYECVKLRYNDETKKIKIASWYDDNDKAIQDEEVVRMECKAKISDEKLYIQEDSGEYIHYFTINFYNKDVTNITSENDVFFKGERLFSRVE